MPIHPSARLLKISAHLRTLTGKLAEGRRLKWKQTYDFCEVHVGETSVIPLGVRDGFEVPIDFLRIPERLSLGWIGEDLATLADQPARSPIFRSVKQAIGEMGARKWRSAENQASSATMSLRMPG